MLHLYGALTPFHRSARQANVFLYLAKFLSQIAQEYWGVSTYSLDALCQETGIYTDCIKIDKEQLFKTLKKEKLISTFPVAVFLTTELIGPRSAEFLRLQALGMVVVAWYLESGRSESDLKKFCYCYRYMLLEKGKWLFEIALSLTELNDLKKNLPENNFGLNQYKKNKFKELFYPIISLVDGRGANAPHGLIQTNRGGSVPQKIIELDENDEGKISIIHPSLDISTRHISIEEQQFDQDRSTVIMELDDRRKKSNFRHQEARKNKAIGMANAYERQTILSPFDFEALTGTEIKQLLKALCANVFEDQDWVSLIILLSIFLGRTPSNILKIKRAANNDYKIGDQWGVYDNLICLIHKFDLPNKTLRKDTSVYEETSDFIELPIPEAFSKVFHKFLCRLENAREKREEDLIEEEFSERFREINRGFNQRLSEKALTQVIENYYENSIFTKIIKGQDPKHFPSLFYVVCDTRALYSVYRYYLNELAGISGVRLIGKVREANNSGMFGSRVVVKKEAAVERFKKLRLCLDDENRWENFHNVYTLYVHQLLSICTGHRAVKSPFENVLEFDFETNQLWLSDKINKKDQSFRIIPLARLAVEQTQKYIEHLRSLCFYLTNSHPELVTEIQGALKGQRPFLFFCSNQKIREVKPETICDLERSYGLTKLVSNWGRHFLYSHSLGAVADDLVLRNFFWHVGFGEEALNPFSELNCDSLRKVAIFADQLCHEMEIRSLNGWRCRNG